VELPVKIAFIAASAVPFNAANSIQVMKTCQAFAQLGHLVHLVVPGSQAGEWSSLKDFYGLSTPFEITWLTVAPHLRRYDLAWKAVRLARRIKADLVYTWMLQVAWLSLWQRLPVMLELHDRITGQIGPTLFRQVIDSRGKKRLLPITQALLNALQQEFKVTFPPGLAVVSPDGVDQERYVGLPEPPAARLALGLPECPTAVYTGHFYAGRGLGLLFDLAQSNPQINFLWVGGRLADIAMWKQRLQSAGVDNVFLPGFVENARLALYQAAGDVLLMPYGRSVSTSSGGNTADICSPMKMFEYMAAGRAILSSDLPVFHEVLNPTNAVFCPVDEPVVWSTALNALIADTNRRITLGQQAQRDVALYTWRVRAQHALEGFF
jgi:glycosyltransferase involved in cell wall biosynthesis